MSVSDLLIPDVIDEKWSHIYANAMDCIDLTITNINIAGDAPLVVDDLTVNGDLIANAGVTLAGNAYPEDVGLSGQVLTTDGAGALSWQTNGSGDVGGPVGSTVDHICVFADGTGKLIADSGIDINNVVVNPLAGTLEANGEEINNLKDIVLTDQAVIAPPAVVGSNKIYSNSADNKIYVLSDLGAGGKIAVNGENAEFKDLSANSGGVEEFKLPTTKGNNLDYMVSDGAGLTSWQPANFSNGIIYQPGGVSSGNIVATWAEVVSIVSNATNNESMIVYIDDSLGTPVISQNLDCKGRVLFRPYKLDAISPVSILFDADIELVNPAAFFGPIIFVGLTAGGVNLVLSNGNIMNLIEGSRITNDPASTTPMLQILDGEVGGIAIKLGGAIDTSNAVPIINVGIGSTFLLVECTLTSATALGNDIISSTDGTATLLIQADGTRNDNTNAGFTGATTITLLDYAANINYDDTAPTLGATTVQGAIDTLKALPKLALSFGATFVAQNWAAYNGAADHVELAAGNSPVTTCICPVSGTVKAVGWYTAAGDATTQCAVVINGVQIGFTLTGATGLNTAFISPITAGQPLEFVYLAGTVPGASNFVVYIE